MTAEIVTTVDSPADPGTVTTPIPPLPLAPPPPPPAPDRHPSPRPPIGRRAWVGIAAVAALLAAFGVGRLSDSDDGAAVQQAVSKPTAEAATGPAGTESLGQVAAVARAAAPSVVQLETEDSVGSGVIYDPEGLILTAAHVVADSDVVAVRLADGRLFEGTVVGAHEPTDIAVIHIDATEPLPVAILGYNDQLQIGELAVALGSPFGLDQTVTAGIVSAVSRPVNGIPMVQTDAAINPGNSGGPLLDGGGNVIGINDVIFTQGGGSDGIGFAVAIDLAIVVAEQITAGLDVELSSLGAATIVATSGEGGAIVRDIGAGSPAEAAGLEVGDRIVAIDGASIDNPAQLFSSIVTHRPETVVTVDFVRGDTQVQTTATLAGIQR